MASIFLCHASQDKDVAERIQVALLNAGHEVFFDSQSLPPSGDYDARIKAAIDQCDLFIFLLSEYSIQAKRYTLSELEFARARWPSPVGQVLAVNIGSAPSSHWPPYVAGATVLEPKGNAPVEVRVAVQRLLQSRARSPGFWSSFGLVSAGVGTLAAVVLWISGSFSDAPAVACRDPSHGIERYEASFQVDKVSEWMGGGFDQAQWCERATTLMRAEGPHDKISVITSSESKKDNCSPFNCVQYQYRCTLKVERGPVYVLKASPACGRGK